LTKNIIAENKNKLSCYKLLGSYNTSA